MPIDLHYIYAPHISCTPCFEPIKNVTYRSHLHINRTHKLGPVSKNWVTLYLCPSYMPHPLFYANKICDLLTLIRAIICQFLTFSERNHVVPGRFYVKCAFNWLSFASNWVYTTHFDIVPHLLYVTYLYLFHRLHCRSTRWRCEIVSNIAGRWSGWDWSSQGWISHNFHSRIFYVRN